MFEARLPSAPARGEATASPPALPVVSGELVAAVLLVDLPTMSVVHTDEGGRSMLPEGHLPIPLDRWGDDAGLVGADGEPLSAARTLPTVARGESRRGVMVLRRGVSPQGAGAQSTQVLWLTGFPLTSTRPEVPPHHAGPDGSPPPAPSHGLRERALLVLLEVSPPSSGPPGDGTADLHNREAIATDLSFTISDPRADDERAREQALASERRARSNLSMLAEIGDALTGMDPSPALQRLCEVLTAGLAAWCLAFEVDDGVRLVASSGISLLRPAHFPLAGLPADGSDPLADLVTGRRRDLVEIRPQDDHPTGTLTRWLADQLRAEEAPGPWVALAAPGRRDVCGLVVIGVPHLPIDDEERDLLRQIGRRTGLSLDNARLYAREHLVAETLQRSMLPEVVDVPGLDLWSFYSPGVEHAQIGGDWYDVLRIDDGTVGLVIGDVVGHDIEAASAMGQLRSVVRAYSADGDDPAAVLMRVDQLVGGMRITRSASLVYANLVDAGAGRWEMSWARAGHLPPILVREGRATALMGAGGPMVGLVSSRRESQELLLSPGDVLVLYTDGLIERRARPMRAGLERLLEICDDLGVFDAAGIGERLLVELGEEPEDDIALVVLRVPVPGEPGPPAGGTRSRRWQLPGEATSIPRARGLTRQVCDLWGLPQGRQSELVVSELVANAVLHGHGTVSLHVREAPGRALRIEVGDANPTPPRRVDGHPDRTGGFGLTVVGTMAQWGWRSEGSGKVVWALVPVGGG